MEDGINSPGLPLGRDYIPTLPSDSAGTRTPQVVSQRLSTPAPGLVRPVNNTTDQQGPGSLDKTRGDQATADVEDGVAVANAIATFLNTKVSFTYDKRIEQIVVKVIRGDSEEVIRQIPSEEMIKMAVQFRQDFRGLIVNRTG